MISLNILAALLTEKTLEILHRDYMEDDVRVVITTKNIHIPTNEGLTELSKGSEYVVPRWIAQILREKELAVIKEEELSITSLSTLAYLEEDLIKKRKFNKIYRFFYMHGLNKLSELKAKLRETSNMELYDIYRKMKELVSTIGMVRIRKLLDLVLLPNIPIEIYETLTNEEKTMLTILTTIIKNWMEKLEIVETK